MDLPKVRGRLLTTPDGAVLVARCPFCGSEHRYPKRSGDAEQELEELVARGFADEWLPCQHDLPGNYWRIFVGRSRRRRKSGGSSAGGARPPVSVAPASLRK